MLRHALVILALSLLSACASKKAPKDFIANLDSSAPHFQSTSCKSARDAAENYDDRMVPRIALGVALTYFVGPLASPLALLADKDESDEKSSVIADLKVNCQMASAK